jgi:hypothetical protein
MPRLFPVNTFTAAWKHFKQQVISYTCDAGVIELRYEDSQQGEINNVVINYIETTDVPALHQMLKTIVDDLPIDPVDDTVHTSQMGTIIFKGYASQYEDFGLHLFQYKNRRFEIRDLDCVMVRTPAEDE